MSNKVLNTLKQARDYVELMMHSVASEDDGEQALLTQINDAIAEQVRYIPIVRLTRGEFEMASLKNEQEHTPPPWQCIPSNDYFDTYHIWPAHLPAPDFSSDDARYPQELANAHFIERACNSHTRLLKALEWIVWEINEGCGDKAAILQVSHTALGR